MRLRLEAGLVLPGGAPGQSLTVWNRGFPGGEMRVVPSTPVVVVRPPPPVVVLAG